MLASTQVWAFLICMIIGVWRYLQNSNKYHKAYTFFLLCRKKRKDYVLDYFNCNYYCCDSCSK